MLINLTSEDVYTRKKAVETLPALATALGEKRCRNELIPFIQQELSTDDYEPLVSVLVQLVPSLVKAIGGNQHIALLFPLVEAFTRYPDKDIRYEATSSIK